MTEHWTIKYMQVPYVPGGRSWLDGLDCWGLVLEAYRRELGQHLGDYSGIALETHRLSAVRAIVRGLRPPDWTPVDVESSRPFDVCFLVPRGRTSVITHMALVADEHRLLHTLQGIGPHLQTWQDIGVSFRIHGIYRHSSQQ